MTTNRSHSTEILLPASQHARIGYHPLKVATMVLHALKAYYWPIYNLAEEDRLRHDALLVFIEGLICQGEEDMEVAAKANHPDVFASWRQNKAQILDLLAEEKISHPRIPQYLEAIEEFFVLIHKLVYQDELTHANVVRAMELAPADFRLLHTIFCCTSGRPVNENLLDLLEPLEVLRDIHWHIINMADDLKHGYFNIYQMFQRIHKEETAARVQTEQERLEALLHKHLAKATAEEQAQIQPILSGYQALAAELRFP